MIKNRIIEMLSDTDKEKAYTALLNNEKVLCTSNKRSAPNSLITMNEWYTIGVSPKDDSYFDFEILPLKKMISKDDIKMVKEYTVKNGLEKGEKAYQQSFNNMNLQYDFEDVLNYSQNANNSDEKMLPAFLDIQESKNNHYCSGFVNIEFRNEDNQNIKYPLFCRSFVLNGEGDLWFRRIEGNFKGYGLTIKKVELKENTMKQYGSYLCYKAKILYLDYNEELQEGLIWFNVHHNFSILDVLEYLKSMYKHYNN